MMKENQKIDILNTPLKKEKAMEWALVLTAMNIPHKITQNETMKWVLILEESFLLEANKQIQLYEQENNLKKTLYMNKYEKYYYPFTFPFLIYLFHLFVNLPNQQFSFVKWGSATIYYIQHGEIWRLVTALTLHKDLPHLFGNMLFGIIFIIPLYRILGSGLSWFLVLLSGILGNYLNTLIHHFSHSSIGASTAVFGAIGILGGIQLLNKKYRHPRFKAWMPFAGAFALLGFLGTSGKNTDVGAHFLGFFSGIIIGVLVVPFILKWKKPNPKFQASLGIISFFIVIISWWVCIMVRG